MCLPLCPMGRGTPWDMLRGAAGPCMWGGQEQSLAFPSRSCPPQDAARQRFLQLS